MIFKTASEERIISNPDFWNKYSPVDLVNDRGVTSEEDSNACMWGWVRSEYYGRSVSAYETALRQHFVNYNGVFYDEKDNAFYSREPADQTVDNKYVLWGDDENPEDRMYDVYHTPKWDEEYSG